MAIIEKDRYRLIEPSRGQDQINGLVSIDIARLNQETA
jgi:hypothetical protein